MHFRDFFKFFGNPFKFKFWGVSSFLIDLQKLCIHFCFILIEYFRRISQYFEGIPNIFGTFPHFFLIRHLFFQKLFKWSVSSYIWSASSNFRSVSSYFLIRFRCLKLRFLKFLRKAETDKKYEETVWNLKFEKTDQQIEIFKVCEKSEKGPKNMRKLNKKKWKPFN